MEIRGVLLGERSIEDVMAAILQGLTVEFMCSYMCTTALGIILKPMVAIFGLSNQVDRIQEAFKKGDPVEITVRIVQLISMVYGLTSQCFTGETLVSTKYGLCPIEEIQKGDYVWSENSETGEKELKKVLSISITETATLVHVITENGTEINTTENHPFYVEGKGWVAASELESGDMLRTQEGKTETVFKIETEKLEEAVKVYNLEIEDNHTYYVSEDEVLVHNECGGESGSESFVDMMSSEEAARYEAYWKQNVSNYNTPNSKIMYYKEHNGIIEKSIVIYDDFGRQKWRIDYNNHGYSNHSIPHIHERDYSLGYDPMKGKEARYDIWN